MPEKIQRVPRGLIELLSISGGGSPQLLEDRIQGGLDFLQLYGQTQLQSGFAFNGAAAEAAAVTLTLHAERWTVLFSVSAAIVKTATMTALRAGISLNRRTQFGVQFVSEELGPFGATETGTVSFGQFLPYPLLCPPGSTVDARCSVIGTDATASVSVFAEFGVL